MPWIQCMLEQIHRQVAFREAKALLKLQALVYDILPSGGRCRKATLGVWALVSPKTALNPHT